MRNSIRNQEHDWMKSFTGFQNWKLEADLQFDRGIFLIQFLHFRLSALHGVSDSFVDYPYGSVYLFYLTISSFHSILFIFFSAFFLFLFSNLCNLYYVT